MGNPATGHQKVEFGFWGGTREWRDAGSGRRFARRSPLRLQALGLSALRLGGRPCVGRVLTSTLQRRAPAILNVA